MRPPGAARVAAVCKLAGKAPSRAPRGDPTLIVKLQGVKQYRQGSSERRVCVLCNLCDSSATLIKLGARPVRVMTCDNDINRMQELLQARCPVDNCSALWRADEETTTRGFRTRIILVNTGPEGDVDMPMPWSHTHARKVDAKKEAAGICLRQLEENGMHPHDPSQLPLMVGLTTGGGGGGSGGGAVGIEAVLPNLTPGLLAVVPVVMAPAEAGVGYAEEGDSDGEDEPAAAAVATSAILPAPPQGRLPPLNLGALGEQYALGWLAEQPWVSSVSSANELAQAVTRDIECVPTGPPGRRHVEVKTRWRRFKRAGASAAQRGRLLDPDDDYMLLIVGFFENLLPSDGREPTAPQIRVLPNTRSVVSEEQGQAGRSRPGLEPLMPMPGPAPVRPASMTYVRSWADVVMGRSAP